MNPRHPSLPHAKNFPVFKPNDKQIVKVITSTSIAPSAKEQAADLVDAWISENSDFDLQYKTVAVEVPWYYWIQPQTVLVGVMDRIAKDAKGTFGCEWKSAKEPQKNANGEDSAWWNEEVWLKSISEGTQLSIYGLAMLKAHFVPKGVKGPGWMPSVSNPRILVRAAVKSNPVRFWPTNPDDGIFEFPDRYLTDIVTPALIAKAEQLRAAKLSRQIPWALPGNHCFNRFRKECPYHQQFCLSHKHPSSKPRDIFDEQDPGYAAFLASGALKKKDDPNLIVLSASSFDTAQQCPERYRILVGGYAPKEQDPNLDTGTGMHAGVAEFYRQQMKHQGLTHKGK